MQLTYRGLTYDYRPPQVETEADVLGLSGSYLGLDYRFRNPHAKNIIHPSVNLTYRGVAFNQGDTAQTQPVVATVPDVAPQVAAPSFAQRTRARLHEQTKAIKKRQQSLLLRLASEIGLDGAEASHHPIYIQGKVQPSFQADYSRRGVAMS